LYVSCYSRIAPGFVALTVANSPSPDQQLIREANHFIYIGKTLSSSLDPYIFSHIPLWFFT
jgi:hypothetical protein